MNRIELAVFDLDGVLTETSRQHFLAWKQLSDELGLFFDHEINELLKGVSRIDSLDIILRKNEKTGYYSEKEKKLLSDKKNIYYKELIESIEPEDLFEGVLQLFETLKKRNIHIALASASFNAPLLLKKLDITHWIEYVVNPGEIAKGKPDPEIFLKAAEHFSISPKYTIGFEDSIAGLKAIKAAKMFAVGIGDAKILSQADIIYPSIRRVDIEEILNRA